MPKPLSKRYEIKDTVIVDQIYSKVEESFKTSTMYRKVYARTS